jgi:hypothetical protein
MAKDKTKKNSKNYRMTRQQRNMQIILIIISAMIIVSMALSLMVK